MELPLSPDEITPDWLTRALGAARPGIVIRSAIVKEFIGGASTKVRMAITSNMPDFPGSIIIKAGFESHSAAMASMHRNEMHAYRDFIPTLDVNAPRCFFAHQDESGNALVILEDLDLRSVSFLNLQQPLDFDRATAFVDALAKIHARWWDAPALKTAQFSWLPDTSEEQFDHYFAILNDPASFARFAEAPRCAAMPRILLDPPRVRAAHKAMRLINAREPMTIAHGDMHLGNLYIDDDGEPGLLDWQPRLAPWSLDVCYFLIAGLDLVDRRDWEKGLIARYLETLRGLSIDAPDFEHAWILYRCNIVWGLLIWMLNGSHFQTEANNTAAATRFAMAMIDHDTFGLLGV
jgi:Ecdysteroid kinase-like family